MVQEYASCVSTNYHVILFPMQDIESRTIEAVKNVGPAVVSIVISKFLPQIKQGPMMPFGPFSFEIPVQQDGQGEKVKVGGGSGFIVHPNGLILTNKHVVFDQDAEYTAVTSDGKEYPAKVICVDPMNDIAVVQIHGSGLPAVKLGNSSGIELGQTVIAIGNALGLFSNTVSKGIISGLGRKISASLGPSIPGQGGGMTENLRDVIQTDVAINQGNSGGPLINLNGEVVGINTAIIFGAQNIGFAIPINWAKQDLEDIIKHGRIIRPFIGLRYIMLNDKFQKQYSLPVAYGALVVKDHVPGSEAVIKGSPAHKAGVQENDIILEINGEKIDDKNDVADVIQKLKVGDSIELTVLRKDTSMKVTTVLEEMR